MDVDYTCKINYSLLAQSDNSSRVTVLIQAVNYLETKFHRHRSSRLRTKTSQTYTNTHVIIITRKYFHIWYNNVLRNLNKNLFVFIEEVSFDTKNGCHTILKTQQKLNTTSYTASKINWTRILGGRMSPVVPGFRVTLCIDPVIRKWLKLELYKYDGSKFSLYLCCVFWYLLMPRSRLSSKKEDFNSNTTCPSQTILIRKNNFLSRWISFLG